jgi:hypothetical protein
MNAGAWPNAARDEIDRVFGLESAIAHLSGARVDEDFRANPISAPHGTSLLNLTSQLGASIRPHPPVSPRTITSRVRSNLL